MRLMTILTIGKQWEFGPKHKYFFGPTKIKASFIPNCRGQVAGCSRVSLMGSFWRSKVLKSEPFPCCPGLVVGYQLNSPHDSKFKKTPPPLEKIKHMDAFCKNMVHLKWVAYFKSACHSILISDCPHAFDKGVSFHYPLPSSGSQLFSRKNDGIFSHSKKWSDIA